MVIEEPWPERPEEACGKATDFEEILFAVSWSTHNVTSPEHGEFCAGGSQTVPKLNVKESSRTRPLVKTHGSRLWGLGYELWWRGCGCGCSREHVQFMSLQKKRDEPREVDKW